MCQILFFTLIPLYIVDCKVKIWGLCLPNPGVLLCFLFCKSLYALAVRVNFIYSFIYTRFLESDQLGSALRS